MGRKDMRLHATSNQTPANCFSTTGPYSAYESPHKSSSGFADLRNPSNRPLFSQSNHPGMPNPFATPRVSHESDIPSSGPETSPENVDSDATPDTSRALIKGVCYHHLAISCQSCQKLIYL